MKQCLRISFTLVEVPVGFLQHLQQNAQGNGLEGTGQIIDEKVLKVTVCGNPQQIESFIDFIHQTSLDLVEGGIEIEPFIRQKDYRGVFRIIE